LESADDTSFADNGITLCASSIFYAADLTASKIMCAIPIPAGARRYIRGSYKIPNYSAGAQDFSACSYSMFIVRDADALISGVQ
jgi:hypothetical protein